MTAPRMPILVVEDDDSIRNCLVEALRTEGYSVEAVKNGQEALDYLIGSPPPSLILLDLVMPVMDGWSFLEKYKQMNNNGVPIVVASSVAKQSELIGVSEILEKPYETESVLEIVRKYS